MNLGWQHVITYDDYEFLGGTQTREVSVTGALTEGHGIYLEARVPKKVLEQQGANIAGAAVLGYVTIYETLAGLEWVSGVAWGQRQLNGQLQDIAYIVVVSSSGNSSTSLTVPLRDIGPQAEVPLIDKTHAQLDALEHL